MICFDDCRFVFAFALVHNKEEGRYKCKFKNESPPKVYIRLIDKTEAKEKKKTIKTRTESYTTPKRKGNSRSSSGWNDNVKAFEIVIQYRAEKG